jgi:hypothetical protein
MLYKNPNKKQTKWEQLLLRTKLKQQRTTLEKWSDVIQGMMKKAEK